MNDILIRSIIFVFVVVFLLIMSAFVSGTETAYTAINDMEWKLFLNKVPKNQSIPRSYRLVNFMRTKYSITVACALFINNILAVAAGIFVSNYLITLNVNPTVASITSVVLITVLFVFFGDFVPKNLFRKNSIRFVTKTAYFMFFLWVICFPICYWFGLIFKQQTNTKLSKEYIDQITDLAIDDKVLDQNEGQLVSSALELNSKLVQDYLSENPVYAYKSDSLTTLLKIYQKNEYTRILILNEDESIYGVLNYKVLLSELVDGAGKLKPSDKINIDNSIQDPLFINCRSKLDEALRKMQKFNAHLGVVTNSEGSKDVLGIITIEDILEELVGEIYDENDDDLEIQIINDFTFVINPNAPANAVVTALQLDFHDLDPKLKARNFFHEYFQKSKLKLNSVYENEVLQLKVERDLDTRKYQYYVIKHQATETANNQ